MGHAFAFVYAQLMRDASIPVVPVLLNALYPPDQPNPERCLDIGEAIEHAVEAFPGNARVGVVASGGLSHFVVDEDLDRTVVQALTERDHATLVGLPEAKLNSGSAEIRNWICAGGRRCGHCGCSGWTIFLATGRGRAPESGWRSPSGSERPG